MPSTGPFGPEHYDPRAAHDLAAELRRAASLVQQQASQRASLRATLLSDCWTGNYHDQQYEPSFLSQQGSANDLDSRLQRIAGQVEILSGQLTAQAQKNTAEAAAHAAVIATLHTK